MKTQLLGKHMMLQKWFLPQMNEDSGDFIFQQDRTPPHWHQDFRRFLNQSLPQQWIGLIRNEDLVLLFWAPTSPDQSHLRLLPV
jgi:hypothetical protein